MRQIVLDTETTGLYPDKGHKIVEIGCVEIISRKKTGGKYHTYLNPLKEIDEEAVKIHGLKNDFLSDKPIFSEQADKLWDFLQGSELIIHNAPFDLGFLNAEFQLIGKDFSKMRKSCKVIDTLILAKKKHPGQKNNLDALCKRYGIDNSHRELHGALLDAEILADVYLSMTGGQTSISWQGMVNTQVDQWQNKEIQMLPDRKYRLPVIKASRSELEKHEEMLSSIAKK